MQKPIIYITRQIPEALLEPYKEQFTFTMWHKEDIPVPKEVLYEEVRHADGLLCLLTEKIDRAFLEHAPHLSIIANMAVGYDNIDVKTAKEKGIIITNTPDVLTETTADLTFALLMATARRIIEAATYLTDDKWGDWSPFLLAGTDVFSKTIGIVGMGRIGEAVGRRAQGFGMNIVYHNRRRDESIETSLDATYVSFEQLLEQSDFVVSLLPLTKDTVDTFNKAAFNKMKETAIFINASRGGIVDEHALYDALKHKIIQAAGLDVFKQEPIDSTHPLASLPNAVLLPHIGSASVKTRKRMLQLCLENISLVGKGAAPLTAIES